MKDPRGLPSLRMYFTFDALWNFLCKDPTALARGPEQGSAIPLAKSVWNPKGPRTQIIGF